MKSSLNLFPFPIKNKVENQTNPANKQNPTCIPPKPKTNKQKNSKGGKKPVDGKAK